MADGHSTLERTCEERGRFGRWEVAEASIWLLESSAIQPRKQMGVIGGRGEEWTRTILSCFQHGVATAPAALIQCATDRVQGARSRASSSADGAMPSTMKWEVRSMGEWRRGRSKAVDGLSRSRIRIHGGREEREGATEHGLTTRPLRTATGRPALLSMDR